MSTTLFDKLWSVTPELNEDILSQFKKKTVHKKDVLKEMSSEELADFVSDRLIEEIKRQFKETEIEINKVKINS
jgi:uncharacterized protein YaaW (UPF0174 family)